MGSLISKKHDQHKTETGTRCFKKRKERENCQEKLADELHKPVERNFTPRRVIVNHIDEMRQQIWLKCNNSANGKKRDTSICLWLLMFSANMEG